jgi:hypothetical protein
MMFEKLYWVSVWNDAVRRSRHVRSGSSDQERQAFERRMRVLSDRHFLRYPRSA